VESAAGTSSRSSSKEEKMGARRFLEVGMVVVLACIVAAPAARHASAEEAPGGGAIGFVDLQRVFADSIKGREAAEEIRARLEAKQRELDEESRMAQELQLEINKKSSLWNEETRQQKEEEYRRLVRDLKRHAEDVKQELNEEMETVWKKLLREIATRCWFMRTSPSTSRTRSCSAMTPRPARQAEERPLVRSRSGRLGWLALCCGEGGAGTEASLLVA